MTGPRLDEHIGWPPGSCCAVFLPIKMIAAAAGGRIGLSGFRVSVVYSKSQLLPELVRMLEEAWKA
jgi:hypothetical protein